MELNYKSKSRMFAEVAIIASLYVVLTVFLPMISYSQIQFRISEALLILVLFRKSSIPGLILGCLIANVFSPFGLPDVIFGTMGSVLAVSGIYLLRKKPVYISILPGVIANAVLVGVELWWFAKIPLWFGFLSVFAGQFVVLYALGIPFFYALKKIGFKSDYENVLQK